MPSQASASKIDWTFSGVERSRSVSSMRRTSSPPWPRASSQLYRAVLALPMWSAPVGDGGNRTRMATDYPAAPMLIGAHVSPAGGPAKAVERGEERGCRSIQIFNQNPRAWKPTVYSDEQVADFHEAIKASKKVDALLIHAVYLINCASEDPDFRQKSLTSLIASLRAGAALGAVGVVLHAGSALNERSRRRSGDERGARGRGGD